MIDPRRSELIASVKGDIRNSVERVRASEIKECPLEKIETMSKINQFQPLCRYNCQEKILYFNHSRYTNSEINRMITNSFEIYQILKKKSEIEESRDEDGRKFGGYGGLGRGMGGMEMMI